MMDGEAKVVNRQPRINSRLSSEFKEIEVTMTFKNSFSERLCREAEARKTTPVELLADLLEAIVEDDLFAALLDK